MKNSTKAKEIEEFYRLIWSSLESHLEYTYKNSYEGQEFHKKCVKEYVRMLELLKKLS